jgi:hypothetical protein
VLTTPTMIIDGNSAIEFGGQVLAALIGAGAALLVYFLGQGAARKRQREEDSVRAAGDVLLAMAHYQRMSSEEKPVPAGSHPHFARFMSRTLEPEAFELLRAAVAIHTPRVTDRPAREAVKALVSHLAITGWRRPEPESDVTPENPDARAQWEADERERLWAAADSALTRYLESQT